MFKKRRWGNIISSDEGYEVQIDQRGMNTIVYIENGREINVNAETISPGSGLCVGIWKDSIKKAIAAEGGDVHKDSDRILANLEAALKFGGWDVEVIESSD